MLVRTPISHLRASSREDHSTLCHKDDPSALDWIIEATGFLEEIPNSVGAMVSSGRKETFVSEVFPGVSSHVCQCRQRQDV